MKKLINLFFFLLLLLTLVGCIEEKDENIHVITPGNSSPYILIKAKTYNINDFEGNRQQTTSFDMFLNVDNNLAKYESLDYEITFKNVLGESTKYESHNPLLVPFKEQILHSTNVGGSGFGDILLTLYNKKGKTDETKEIFYEKALSTTNKEIKEKGYPTEFISDTLTIDFNISEDDEKYVLDFTVESNKDIHLDLQSFLVTDKDFNVYTFFGVYGYSWNKFPLIVKDNYIYKDIGIKYLYLRLVYYDNEGNQVENRVRLEIENLI